MKQILFKRGLWIPGMTMTGGKKGQEPNKMSMPAVLRAQKDFANVDSSLEVLLKRRGGVALMLPKFHCKLNPIELCGVDLSGGSAETASTLSRACERTFLRATG